MRERVRRETTRIDWGRAGWLPAAPIAVAAILALTFATAGQAAEGSIPISQERVTAGGINGSLVSDPAGFPVVITAPGNYVLTGNLSVPDVATTAISVTVSDVSIDLNGFAIRGVVTCFDSPPTCDPGGVGDGISCTAGAHRLRVTNGVIRGLGNRGIDCGTSVDSAHVEGVAFSWNRSGGLLLGDHATVTDCVALQHEGTALEVGTDSLVSHSVAIDNLGGGIRAGARSNVFGNAIADNTADGIQADVYSRISGNASQGSFISGISTPFVENGESHSTIEFNATSQNLLRGISAGTGANVQYNASASNYGVGIYAAGGSSVVGNTVFGNTEEGIEFQVGATDIGHGLNNASGNSVPQIPAGNIQLACDIIGGAATCP